MKTEQEIQMIPITSKGVEFPKLLIISTFMGSTKNLKSTPGMGCIEIVLEYLKNHGLITGSRDDVDWKNLVAKKGTTCIELHPARDLMKLTGKHLSTLETELKITLEATSPAGCDDGNVDFTILNISFYKNEPVDFQAFAKAFTRKYTRFLETLVTISCIQVETRIETTDDEGACTA